MESMNYKGIDIHSGNHLVISYDSFSGNERDRIGHEVIRELSQKPHEILDIHYDTYDGIPDMRSVNFEILFDNKRMWIRSRNVLKILTDYHPFILFEKVNKIMK